MPGEVGGVERLGAFLAGAGVQSVQFLAHAVARGEQPPLRQQAPLLGEQQEHHPHHHRYGCLVHLGAVLRQRIGIAAADGVQRRLRQCLDQQLDGAADLGAERLGDLLGGGDGFAEQLGEPVLRPAADQPAALQQLDERVAGLGFLDPGLGVDDAGGDHGLLAGADDRPPAAVGDQADGDLPRAQQLFHAVNRAGGPAVIERVAQRVDRIDDEDQRAGHVAVQERPVGAYGHGVVR